MIELKTILIMEIAALIILAYLCYVEYRVNKEMKKLKGDEDGIYAMDETENGRNTHEE